jgi:hypothetical protein
MDHDADFRAHEKGSATIRAKVEPRPNVSWSPPSIRPTGPLRFCVTPDALLRRAEKCSYAKGIARPHLPPSGEHGLCGNPFCIMWFLGFWRIQRTRRARP